MAEATQTTPEIDFDTLIGWLGQKNPKRNQAAVALLSRLGREALPILFGEALKPGKRSHHRVAVLNIIEQIIVAPLQIDEFSQLHRALRHRDPAVREKAEQILMAASPGGMPNTPEGLAMLRAFHPLLCFTPPRSNRKRPGHRFAIRRPR